MTTTQDGGKVVSLTHRQLLPQEMFLVLISIRSWVDSRAILRSEGFCVNEKSTDTSWDRTSDFPTCSTAPYPLCYRGPHFPTCSTAPYPLCYRGPHFPTCSTAPYPLCYRGPHFAGKRTRIFTRLAWLCYPIILDQQQLFRKQDEPVCWYNGETAPLLWAEICVHCYSEC